MADKKKYVRDKRSPTPSSENVSKVMSNNKGKDTKPELLLRTLLWKNGIRGYRIHPKKIPGKPDVCFISRKVAVFINGCFWHRCTYCNYKLPKQNKQFWENKFSNNVRRDKEKIMQLKKMKWKVINVWECQLKKHKVDKTLNSIIRKIGY
ncbi:very short patch repair endonuclease [Ferruginibacter sp. SUN002]|uniref:very short patch repair endonuclease n=1 Tax=Ferruginibacter sp. SUN002 TaxID=2937789 RepID=UPI003D35F04C